MFACYNINVFIAIFGSLFLVLCDPPSAASHDTTTQHGASCIEIFKRAPREVAKDVLGAWKESIRAALSNATDAITYFTLAVQVAALSLLGVPSKSDYSRLISVHITSLSLASLTLLRLSSYRHFKRQKLRSITIYVSSWFNTTYCLLFFVVYQRGNLEKGDILCFRYDFALASLCIISGFTFFLTLPPLNSKCQQSAFSFFNQLPRSVKPWVVSLFVGWIGFELWQIINLRLQVQAFRKLQYNEQEFGFGQILALMSYLPTIISCIAIFRGTLSALNFNS